MPVTREAVIATCKAMIESNAKTPRDCCEAAMRITGGADVMNAPLVEVLSVLRVVDLFQLADQLEGK